MTGEITLRGRVLAIGGLREKTMGALRAGIKTVIIPAENVADLDEIDQTVRKALNFIPVSYADEALDAALAKPVTDAQDAGSRVEKAEKPAHSNIIPKGSEQPAVRQ